MSGKASKRGWFDSDGFYSALDGVRRARSLTWKKVAEESGVAASTLTRMAQGKRPDVDGLAALCAWSGLNADNFVRLDHDKPPVETLAMISTYLRSDRNLSPESASALDALVKAAYDRLRRS